jgi:uncharacterized protein
LLFSVTAAGYGYAVDSREKSMPQVRWKMQSGSGIEHLVLQSQPDGYSVESVLTGQNSDGSYAIQYSLRCDKSWRTRFLSIQVIGGATLVIHGDGEGHWTDEQLDEIPDIEGCVDVDIVATPFTNTLPIRRLTWHRGMQQRIAVAWVSIPDLQVVRADQIYTCIEPGSRFRYESADSGFTAELEVDSDGLVIDYPELFERLR